MNPTSADFTIRPLIQSDRQTYYRLIAFWVVCEAFLGGIIHGLRLPVSGLLIGSCSVICICMIAWCNPEKGAILKATIVVAIFKMMLSPQSPFPAYIAVLFQGLMGELLFANRKYFRTSCLLLGITALLESGIQRIIVLTLLYGNGFWEAVNEFIRGITHEKTVTFYSQYLAAGYVALHFFAGAVVGGFAGTIPKRISRWRKEMTTDVVPLDEVLLAANGSGAKPIPEMSKAAKKIKKRKAGLLITWIVLLLLYVQSAFSIGEPLLSSHLVVRMLVRSFLIVLTWYFLVAPFLMKGLSFWLEKQKAKSQNIVSVISALLPSIRMLVEQSWQRTQGKSGWRRLPDFGRRVLVSAMTASDNMFILTGPVQTGKTTRLQKWAMDRKDAYGILSPVIEGKRFFLDLKTNQTFPMEAAEGETDGIPVGKYRFSPEAFQRAKNILNAAAGEKSGWVVVDEIGPLELQGKGFNEEVHALLRNRSAEQKLIFVIREGILEKAVKHFDLEGSYRLIG